jgi:hypothetical protein
MVNFLSVAQHPSAAETPQLAPLSNGFERLSHTAGLGVPHAVQQLDTVRRQRQMVRKGGQARDSADAQVQRGACAERNVKRIPPTSQPGDAAFDRLLKLTATNRPAQQQADRSRLQSAAADQPRSTRPT